MSGAPSPPTRDDPFRLVGTLLDRKYRVDRLVAQGGFGVVYAGHHLALDVPVAIKLLKPASEADPEDWVDLIAQFLDEAKTLAKLRHPNVVAVLDAGVAPSLQEFAGGAAWMVLEWLEGTTLRDDLLARRGRGGRSPAECMEIMRPVLEAIAEAHEVGIVHRDLKPSNIMLVSGPHGREVRVLDFGIAKMMQPEGLEQAPSGDTATESRVSSFTAASAAPEQLSGARTGPWTDVFALGLVLTELLTDRAPLPTDDRNEHYRAVFAAERPTPRKLGADVGAWEDVLARALAVAPAARQANAEELLAQLLDALPRARAGEVASSDRSSGSDLGFAATERAARARDTIRSRADEGARPRARRVIAGAIAAGALLVAGAVGIRSYLRVPAPAAGGAPKPSAVCTSNAACVRALGRAAICRHDRGECVALDSEDCTASAEPRDLESDDTLWVAAFFPKTGPAADEYGLPNHHAVELARRDFARTMGGISTERARPIAVLACDDAADAKRAATHAVERVGVPAVIGFKSGVEAMDLANSLFLPRGVLTLVATNTNPLITKLPHPPGPRLVVRTTFSAAAAAPAIARFVDGVLEPSLHGNGPLRVALVRARDQAGADLRDALFGELRFNGKTALENADDYLEVAYDLSAPEDDPSLASVADALLAFRPHVIVWVGGRSAVRGIVAPVERLWRGGAPRPRWVSVAELDRDVVELVGSDAQARSRFFGVTPVSETPANARFVSHFQETFSDPISRAAAPNSSYDAFYLLAYASYALAPDEPATGARLAGALRRLVPPGRSIDVGIGGIFDAFAALRAGESIDLVGATGSLDFDLERGEAPFDYSILCVARGKGGGEAAPSGLVYLAGRKSLDGRMGCGD